MGRLSACTKVSLLPLDGNLRTPPNATERLPLNTTRRLPSNATSRPPSQSASFLQDVCRLWDDSCLGNRTLALNEFFGSINKTEILNDVGSIANTWLNRTVINWMRSPQCMLSSMEWLASKGLPTDAFNTALDDGGNCCHQCNLYGGDVEIYYWPELNANKSCLSTIGNSTNPPLFGATTDPTNPTFTYWAVQIEACSRDIS